MPFTYLHVFTFSERPGTPAATMQGSVPIAVRKDRNRVLRELAAAKNAQFRERLLGQEVGAVTMEPAGLALTENFIHAQLDLPYAANRLVRLRPRALTAQGVTASIITAA
jgi:threonylcarbamoyladenosine tRNA methylthiotransferase MtaB